MVGREAIGGDYPLGKMWVPLCGREELGLFLAGNLEPARHHFGQPTEVRREFAPYAGVVWLRRYGAGNFPGAAGSDQNELSLAVGLRVWL